MQEDDAGGRGRDEHDDGPGLSEPAREDDEDVCYFGLIWYRETQSFTVAQSMLSKNVSM
jgi:hypothetical protein